MAPSPDALPVKNALYLFYAGVLFMCGLSAVRAILEVFSMYREPIIWAGLLSVPAKLLRQWLNNLLREPAASTEEEEDGERGASRMKRRDSDDGKGGGRRHTLALVPEGKAVAAAHTLDNSRLSPRAMVPGKSGAFSKWGSAKSKVKATVKLAGKKTGGEGNMVDEYLSRRAPTCTCVYCSGCFSSGGS